MKKEQLLNEKTFWKISLGYKGSDWKNSLRDSEAAMGNFMTKGLSDIMKYSTPQDLQKKGMSPNSAHQLWNFCNGIKIGDIIVPYAKNYIQGVGIVMSDFIFRSDTKYWEDEEYVREVKWINNLDEISIHKDPVLWIKAGKGPFARNATIVKLKDHEAERLIEVLLKNKVDIESLVTGLKNNAEIDNTEIIENELSDGKGTEKESLVKSRIGQNDFRQSLIDLWETCSVTDVANKNILKASHIKPWKDCTNNERLDPYNGLLLTPNLDTLFDNGLISFDNDGNIMISSRMSDEDRRKLKLSHNIRLRKIHQESIKYLEYHQTNIYQR